jgi:hypothetical protein
MYLIKIGLPHGRLSYNLLQISYSFTPLSDLFWEFVLDHVLVDLEFFRQPVKQTWGNIA